MLIYIVGNVWCKKDIILPLYAYLYIQKESPPKLYQKNASYPPLNINPTERHTNTHKKCKKWRGKCVDKRRKILTGKFYATNGW